MDGFGLGVHGVLDEFAPEGLAPVRVAIEFVGEEPVGDRDGLHDYCLVKT